jgi:hypothetical protein
MTSSTIGDASTHKFDRFALAMGVWAAVLARFPPHRSHGAASYRLNALGAPHTHLSLEKAAIQIHVAC